MCITVNDLQQKRFSASSIKLGCQNEPSSACATQWHISTHYMYIITAIKLVEWLQSTLCYNKKHLKNVGPIRHCEPPHALILHCHSPGAATVARRLRINVHDDDDDNAWQRGPLWPMEWAQIWNMIKSIWMMNHYRSSVSWKGAPGCKIRWNLDWLIEQGVLKLWNKPHRLWS